MATRSGRCWTISSAGSRPYDWMTSRRPLGARLRVNGASTFSALNFADIRARQGVNVAPRRERRRTVADDLYKRLIDERQSFWTVVYPLYMQREITKANVRDLVRKGLEEARGNYKIVARIFNMEARDYKRFLNFLRKHDCQVPFKEYR